MSEFDKSRQDIKINGYVHPVENIHKKPSNNNNPYKTFNPEKKGTDYLSSKNKSVYATFSDKEVLKETSNVCPQCRGEALYICNCELRDKQCEKGHVWYTEKSGHIKTGDPHDE